MSIFSLIAAFGGGAFGAAVGALPAFIMTGIIALVGTGIGLAGGADILTGNIAFGSMFGPHIAFAGGVAAAAFAANKNRVLAGGNLDGGDVAVAAPQGITNGADILYSLNGTGDSSVILVGGLFGIIGFLINHLYANILGFQTDTVAMTVATSGILVRLLIGKTGLLGKYDEDGPREYFSKGNGLVFNILMGLIIGIAVSYTSAFLIKELGISQEIMAANFPPLCFGISAVTLIFAQTGSASPTSHHISLPAANAAVLS
ncbi:MAG: hypothetical protein ACRDD7_09115, partial [Peptostreptococcaceae bacterium]